MNRFDKDFERDLSIQQSSEPATYAPQLSTQTADLLPEFCEYKDDGCLLAAACLECPFPHCIYDQPWGHKKRAIYLRNIEIVRLFTCEKKTIADIATQFNICRRTVIRALANHHS
jgi:hypothetical protein